MHPNYIGQALQQLSGDVRNFAEMPSRNAYRQSMAELEGAKFEAEKPMIEMQAGEAREMMRPATVSDLIPANAPPEIQALIVAENNIEGQPSVYDRWKASTGITEGENGVLMRDGKPMPYYAFRSPRYQGVFTDIMKGAIKADKYADFKSAREGGEPLTPDQKINALRKQGQQIRYLLENAARRGDKIGAEAFMRDAQNIKERIEGLQGALATEDDRKWQKEFEQFKANLKPEKRDKVKVWVNPDNRNDRQFVVEGNTPREGLVPWEDSGFDTADASKPEVSPSKAVDKIVTLEKARANLKQTGGLGDMAFGLMMAIDPERAEKAQENAANGDFQAAEEAIDYAVDYYRGFLPDVKGEDEPVNPGKEIEDAIKAQYPDAYKVGDEWHVKKDGTEYAIDVEGL